jgi:hypothetical protein
MIVFINKSKTQNTECFFNFQNQRKQKQTHNTTHWSSENCLRVWGGNSEVDKNQTGSSYETKFVFRRVAQIHRDRVQETICVDLFRGGKMVGCGIGLKTKKLRKTKKVGIHSSCSSSGMCSEDSPFAWYPDLPAYV